MTDISLYLRDLTKSYDGRTTVLTVDDLEIRKGEFVSLLGPSGSGKTTTLMIVGGFETPTQGEVILNGRSVGDVPPYKRNVGMVFQNYALFPHMSVGRNVGYPLKMRRVSRSDTRARAEAALKMVGLGGYFDRFPSELSGGQQQRVALARALVFEPELVLLDEPFGALDKNLREQMQIELKRIHADTGATMIFVTHDQSEAMVMSDRIVVFSGGRIEQVGVPAEIYARPKTRFVAEFIGDSNIMPCRLAADGTVDIDDIGTRRPAVTPGLAPGHYEALVRPENIEVVGAGQEVPAGALRARMVEKFDYGDMAVMICTLGGTELRIKQPAMRVAGFRAGEDLAVVIPDRAVHVIDETFSPADAQTDGAAPAGEARCSRT
ncbi:ABC transporter ATP-binding protein [Pseudooceanicola algae]|uniref:Vitamin B12 import ATP-binding protein BtuD n=1 Tax=Pseudooceanicola algae TaxID=1537215 RepID=A0A418SL58_9RHOB|nr:ABC transporter ATP-binding protein [Pseudooceanicola algae]QPM90877.1 Vitamin B12 import ATP-binding protein BtuD [Pseudooceanicola algae]